MKHVLLPIIGLSTKRGDLNNLLDTVQHPINPTMAHSHRLHVAWRITPVRSATCGIGCTLIRWRSRYVGQGRVHPRGSGHSDMGALFE
jgi:hypothetical protein